MLARLALRETIGHGTVSAKEDRCLAYMRFSIRPATDPLGSSGSARRPAQPTPDFAQGVAPREKAIAASLALWM